MQDGHANPLLLGSQLGSVCPTMLCMPAKGTGGPSAGLFQSQQPEVHQVTMEGIPLLLQQRVVRYMPFPSARAHYLCYDSKTPLKHERVLVAYT